jgi:hypothetical protein
MTQPERVYSYTRKRAESKAFQILHNVSIVHTLFPNNVRVNKRETIQQLEGFLKQRMMEEADEEFKQTGEIKN